MRRIHLRLVSSRRDLSPTRTEAPIAGHLHPSPMREANAPSWEPLSPTLPSSLPTPPFPHTPVTADSPQDLTLSPHSGQHWGLLWVSVLQPSVSSVLSMLSTPGAPPQSRPNPCTTTMLGNWLSGKIVLLGSPSTIPGPRQVLWATACSPSQPQSPHQMHGEPSPGHTARPGVRSGWAMG